MCKVFLFVIIPVVVFSQDFQNHNPFKSTQNIKKFADHLFCEKDYLRASEEFLSLPSEAINDSINFKIAISLSEIGNYERSEKFFQKVSRQSALFPLSEMELFKLYFISDNQDSLSQMKIKNEESMIPVSQLRSVATLLSQNQIDNYTVILNSFDDNNDDKKFIEEFINLKKNPPYKSPLAAAVFSAILPGSGKIYTQDYGDGITSLLLTGLFTFLSIDNFNNDHNFRGWIFGGLALGFYAGNVYGSAASAQIFNAKFDFDFNFKINSFVEKRNYFMPEYEFCN